MDEAVFLQILNSLLEKAKKKKNELDYGDINDAFNGFEFDEEKMEEVYEFLEAKNIDIINIPEAQDDDDEFLDHQEEEVELLDDVDALEGVSLEDPVRMYLKDIRNVLLIVSTMCTGTRLVLPLSAIPRVIDWRIHQVAYVLNLNPLA